ncbi:hypothetical protein BIV23_44055 [Streptomyces monashensis]|uniref:Uncharacterized protein n=1 Tax=Streptomyces monashensis TaxID=1678012 RepID=A0A1S2NXU2_9ACTN|nr:hypothetical protein BIV23_44055 [Streptomyces monashensis]
MLGLLSDLPRKHCWTIAEWAGETTPDGMQHPLGRAKWEADAVRDDVRGYVVEHLHPAERRCPDKSSEPMSDDVLSIIPTDPQWQPDRRRAERTAALAAELAPGLPDGVEVQMDVTWHATFTPVDRGDNLERIGCPHCDASIDTEWYADLLESPL